MAVISASDKHIYSAILALFLSFRLCISADMGKSYNLIHSFDLTTTIQGITTHIMEVFYRVNFKNIYVIEDFILKDFLVHFMGEFLLKDLYGISHGKVCPKDMFCYFYAKKETLIFNYGIVGIYFFIIK